MTAKKFVRAIRPGAGLLRALVAACCWLLLVATDDAQAFRLFGRKQTSDRDAALRQAAETIDAADAAWRQEDGATAIELYTRAIDALLEIEAGTPDDELGPIRFRRAYCKTQIDRIRFAQATQSERHVTVMKTAPPPVRPADAEKSLAATGTVAAATLATNAEPVVARSPALPAASVAVEIAWARDMVKLDRLDEAAVTLIRVLRADPLNRPARLMLATVRCRQKSFVDALIILEDLRDEREDEAVLLAIAGAYLGATRYYEALLALDRLLSANPLHPDANMNMAYLLLEMSPRRQKEAEIYYRHAVRLGATRDIALERRLGL